MTDQTTINQQLAAHAQSATTTASGGQSDQSVPNRDIIKDLISYIQLSSMKQKEKAMWLLLLPAMEEKHLLKLKVSLQKEVNGITDLYINALSKKV
jgi:hypothetical protein